MKEKAVALMLGLSVASASADTLVKGSIYFDSENTMRETLKLSADSDNEGISRLLTWEHISQRTIADMEIVVIIAGSRPDDPAEFRFSFSPTTYWTFTRCVTSGSSKTLDRLLSNPPSDSTTSPSPSPSPTIIPSATPSPGVSRLDPSPTPEKSPVTNTHLIEGTTDAVSTPTPTPKTRHRHRPSRTTSDTSGEENPGDTEGGGRVWHIVDGQWKWQPANKKAHKSKAQFRVPAAAFVPRAERMDTDRQMQVRSTSVDGSNSP
jgi:hypothetical protein